MNAWRRRISTLRTVATTMPGRRSCAASALILAAVGFVRREDFRPAVMGASLGGAAIAFQFVTWLALVALGLVLLWIVVSNLGEILSA